MAARLIEPLRHLAIGAIEEVRPQAMFNHRITRSLNHQFLHSLVGQLINTRVSAEQRREVL
jgi:hypothetical protein